MQDNGPTRNRPAIEMLLVEDSPSDVFLTTEALKVVKVPVHLSVVTDGVEAMAFLRHQGKYHEAPRPRLILLDLNLPRKDGREVLAEIKSDDQLKCIPIVVLTSSGAEQDLRTAYDLHANCYLVKPATFAEFKEMFERLEAFWFHTVILPPHEYC
jgi:chemotaxis family two-component system response regulator Rcp1